MDKAEYWILDSVATSRSFLHLLADEDKVALVMNRFWHGLAPEELLRTLQHLFANGSLSAMWPASDRGGSTFVPTDQELQAAVAGEIELCYGLTSPGGARWESLSQPDWDRYVDASGDLVGGEICASTRPLVEKYLAIQPYLLGFRPIPGSETWEELIPWEATYWKTLPHGYSVRYRHLEGETIWDRPTCVEDLLYSTEHWYTNYLDGDA